MTAPYCEPDPLRSGQTLDDLERARRIVTGEGWVPFAWLPDAAPPAETSALQPALRVVRWPSTDEPAAYQSQVRRQRTPSPQTLLRAGCLCITVAVFVLAWLTPDLLMALAVVASLVGTRLVWA